MYVPNHHARSLCVIPGSADTRSLQTISNVDGEAVCRQRLVPSFLDRPLPSS
jgi:hypothetical protein